MECNGIVDRIPTYIINLEKRVDRLESSIQEFRMRPEFSVEFFKAVQHRNGATGLWESIISIVKKAKEGPADYILICEDDHVFTNAYSKKGLFEAIETSKKFNADILLGGVSAIYSVIDIGENVVWAEGFTGMQFSIIFRQFFDTLLSLDLKYTPPVDIAISSISNNIFVINPFISIQREFGYSDVTAQNDSQPGLVDKLFVNSAHAIKYLCDGQAFYRKRLDYLKSIDSAYLYDEQMSIATWAVNPIHHFKIRQNIQDEFSGKPEFDFQVFEATQQNIGAIGSWQDIRHLVSEAIARDDDILIICGDSHKFTDGYTKTRLFTGIIDGNIFGADILLGGVAGGFSNAMQISKDLFWINNFSRTQFIIIYKKLFPVIIEATFDYSLTTDDFLSSITQNKMVFFPFISVQQSFDYLDYRSINNMDQDYHEFVDCANRLENIRSSTNALINF